MNNKATESMLEEMSSNAEGSAMLFAFVLEHARTVIGDQIQLDSALELHRIAHEFEEKMKAEIAKHTDRKLPINMGAELVVIRMLMASAVAMIMARMETVRDHPKRMGYLKLWRDEFNNMIEHRIAVLREKEAGKVR